MRAEGILSASPVAGLLHLFTQGFSHWSCRPVRDPFCIHSLVSHFPALPSGSTGPIVPSWSFRPSRSWVSTFFAAGISPVIPARPIPGLIIFTLPPHTSSPFITFHHLSSHFITFHHLITFHHSLTSTLSIVCSPSIAFFTTSYPAGHSGPLGTSFPTLISPHSHGSQRYLVSHSGSPDTLHPTSLIVGSPSWRVCFQISCRTLKAANPKFLTCHLYFDCPSRRGLSGSLCVIMLASRNT